MTVNNTKFVGNYQIGRTLGEGSFATVKFARNRETGEAFAIKIIDKERILKHKMVTQMKREITTMKLIKHPNVVQLKEVLASKKYIYIVLEYVNGGEVFEKIVESGKFPEDQARKYFQQLIHAVDYCHSRGVYHRDLKPENLLLDVNGNLKVSDFGLSALSQQRREDGLLHTTCGTPNYVAPEVLTEKGYDGSSADLWSCGIILYVLLAGYLPFDDSSLISLYKKIGKADFTFPSWFSAGAKNIIKRILDPNPRKRMKMAELVTDEWFKVGDAPSTCSFYEAPDVDDVNCAFSNGEENLAVEPSRPSLLNAFELISMSHGLDLSGLFKEQKSSIKSETRFTSRHPACEILNKMASLATTFGFRVEKKPKCKIKMKCEKAGRKGYLTVASEVFEIGPSLFMVDLKKTNGDTLEYKKSIEQMCSVIIPEWSPKAMSIACGWPYDRFQEELSIGLKDIVWKTEEDMAKGSSCKRE